MATAKTKKKTSKMEEKTTSASAPEETKQKSAGNSKTETAVEAKLQALYDLQDVDSEIDKIRTVRGELPLEVRDLEDEIEGLETRLNNLTEEVKALEASINNKKNVIKDSQGLIKKYEEQQKNVRNNREYDSLNKEIEFQNLEMQLAEKRIKEYKAEIENKNQLIEETQAVLEDKKGDFNHKKSELDDIISETQKEEETLISKSKKAQAIIEDRLLNAYHRIRKNARNGLAVVPIQRDACGGCFNKIPPQRQLDIKSRKKIIVCEHCGRILVDPELAGVEQEA